MLLAGFGSSRPRAMLAFAGVNAALVLGAAALARWPLPVPGAQRIARETSGWRDLAAYVAGLDGPVLAGDEQTTSMTRFHEPGLRVATWPGITQPSEFARRAEWQYYTREDLRRHGSFHLVLDFPVPPRLAGFTPVAMTEVRDCREAGLVMTDAADFSAGAPPCPGAAVHRWYVVTYRATRSTG